MKPLTLARKRAKLILINGVRERKTPVDDMVSGFRAIHGREIAQMLLKKEALVHPKEAVRNTSIFVERLGLIDGEMREFTQIAKDHKLSVGRVKFLFEMMLRKAIRSDAIRPELFAQAGLELNQTELLKRILRNMELKRNKK